MKAALVLLAMVLVLCYVTGPAEAKCSPGSDLPSAGCTRKRCGLDGRSITTMGCATAKCPPGKEGGVRKGDQSKPYPRCCPVTVCKA